MNENALIPQEVITQWIYFIRGRKVMLDRDLARLYGVPTGQLNQQVKRNMFRFPADFMFQLTEEEMQNWISQFVISKSTRKGIRKRPFAFTENGIAMLSSVLNSERAIRANIQIMRTFTKIRDMLAEHRGIFNQLNKHEVKLLQHDRQFENVLQALKEIREMPGVIKKRRIGFVPPG